MSQMLELPDTVYQALLEAAQASGKTPVAWIAEQLPKMREVPTAEERQAARARLRQFTVALGHATGTDNEGIDADLAKETPMIDLTPQQTQALQSEKIPARVRDPETNATYVLVPTEVYERVKALFEEDDNQFVRDMYPHVMEVFGREGWDDPAMDIYNDLDPRRPV